jgi:cysteine desulfurase / selenocysteine lyase
MIYLDNAATSFPKPECVPEAVLEFITRIGGSAGRSGHRLSAEAARSVFNTRESVAELLGVSSSRRILFSANATEALNLALTGYLRPGDHVVTTMIEHNSITRPLYYLEDKLGVKATFVATDNRGYVDPAAIKAALTPKTRLVVINHASNVTGVISPLVEIRSVIGDIPLLVDGAQTAGSLPINLEELGVDIFAFTGHKSLFGPQGVGGLYIRRGLSIKPLIHGGTGSGSEGVEQPEILPDYYESGTLNGPGLAGLGAGVRFLLEMGIDEVRNKEMTLFNRLRDQLYEIDGVTVYHAATEAQQMPTLSFTIDGLMSSRISHMLDRRYDIMTRPSLHCSPLTHKSIGTFPHGTVRYAISIMNTADEMDQTAAATAEIAKEAQRETPAS